MTAANPQTSLYQCPGCGAKFDVPHSMAGRRARCGKCGMEFKVAEPPVAAPTPTSEEDSGEETQWIGFECRVCQTRLYGTPSQVGKEIKCPDCGGRTVVPPPPPPKKKNIPAALEGEQYELWDVDEHPMPSQLVERQPKLVALTCRNCATLMYAKENQVGKQVACPDCGTKQIVPEAPKPQPKRDVLARDVDTPKVDPTKAPGDLPAFAPVTTRGMQFEEEQEAEYAAALEKSRRTGKPMEIDVHGQPVMPRWPLVTGILGFPFHSESFNRLIALALTLVAAGGLLVEGVYTFVVAVLGTASGSLEAMAGLAETMFGLIFVILWIGAASSVFIAIVAQSAAGRNRMTDWPTMNFMESMGEMLPVSVAAIFTAAPGFALGHLAGLELWQFALVGVATLVLGFPVAFLSQMAGSSTFELVDLRIIVAMFRCPFSTMLFYLEAAVLLCICLAPAVPLALIHHLLPFVLAPLWVYCMMVYARLLGRLGWRLAEAMPIIEDPPPEGSR